MTPQEFITRWADNPLTERAGAQAHFDDLCELLGVAKPRDPDNYCFERGAKKAGGGDGWADVWKRGHFGWENKSPKRDLVKALEQLRAYAGNLDNPPLQIVCDRERIEIHTVFRGYPDEPRTILLKDIGHPANLQTLRWVFTDPDKLKPRKSNAAITQEVAAEFANLAESMRLRGLDAQQVAHFLTQCLFCMFAEDEGLLHDSPTDNHAIFAALLKSARIDTAKAALRITDLFTAMQNDGGRYGNDSITWFNGGLFKKIDVPPLTLEDMGCLYRVTDQHDWRAIDPTIFGTLFESGLDPSSRAELGAHFTDVATIHKIIDPLITIPLRAEWQVAKASIAEAMVKFASSIDSTVGADKTRAKNRHRKAAENTYYAYMERLRNFRVLDAACGSGNFLYLALHALKDLEHTAQLDADALGLQQQQLGIECGTQNILGIEINEYAAELARVTVWIGDIQWCQRNGRPIHKRPVLHSLDSIEHRDALLNTDGTEAQWPQADVLVGNPPFLGGSKKRGELGDAYFAKLEKVFANRVPGGADLVCYWFDKARAAIQAGRLKAAGLVSTNSIRGGSNRKVLDAICQSESTLIFEAWSDEAWVNYGAAVRVSLVCFGRGSSACLNGVAVPQIYADLTAPSEAGDSLNLSKAALLPECMGTSFQGASKKAKFEIDAPLAREWLRLPNPHGRPNSDVLKPWANGFELSRGPQHQWIIDFGNELSESDASLYDAPFAYVVAHVKQDRLQNNREAYRKLWWRFAEPRPGLRRALVTLPRFIATVAHSKHRFFVWLPISTSPDQALITFARADDTSFGLLHSRFHELWSLRMGTSLEDRPRYTPTTCFETFPFPEGLTPADTSHQRTETLSSGAVIPLLDDVSASNQAVAPVEHAQEAIKTVASETITANATAIANAAKTLNDRRLAWLNPPEWTHSVPEVIPLGMSASPYPNRIEPKPDISAADLKALQARTLTNLYNARPAWLTLAHQTLDKAVAAAYGWSDYTEAMTDDEVLGRLLKLNLERAVR
ncbi:MAG: class I SAM-dependent DNA methyltransferase [Rhodoferax sp.]|uniref:class I SAM-dependent DNA methyltransferase n=1 Tax=Rhodoferax sp. TaxID=50421 RepID=UPI0013FF1898|nr:DNA methyltransferase [Rhodoferax sp.]NDP40492.1 class I SAM-dependent DNA methyltransferase [Rhodoferax sp.]